MRVGLGSPLEGENWQQGDKALGSKTFYLYKD